MSPRSDDGPVPFVVALTFGRRQVVQPFDLLGAQFHGVGGGVLFDAGNPLGAGNRRDVVALREQPRQNDLCRGWSRPSATARTSSKRSAPSAAPTIRLVAVALAVQ